ncbi:MAG: hypothetical protein LBM74_08085 [Oscillospiraceae bacterium]|nr:hypothetical protein [Oscillospiraceae bacterium]
MVCYLRLHRAKCIFKRNHFAALTLDAPCIQQTVQLIAACDLIVGFNVL